MNRFPQSVIVCLATALIPVALHAQTPSTKPIFPPPAPETVSLDQPPMKLKEFLLTLQEKIPSFQYVAEPGAWMDVTLPELHLRNVTVRQITHLLTDLNPGLIISDVTSGGGHRDTPLLLFSPARSSSNSAEVRVQTFGLSRSVDYLLRGKNTGPTDRAGNERVRKDALNQILSLLENTAKESAGSATSAEIRFHQETETVLVKGTYEQINAVAQAVSTLQPTASQAQLDKWADQLREAHAQIDSLHQEVLKREQEVTELKVRLEAAQGKKDAEQKH